MVLFALSCFSLVLYLWISFGGSVPLKPQSYRVNASFNEAVQLASEADVRISGVPVGKVKKITPSLGKTEAVLEIQPRYAPLPNDVKATLRTKTILGETYVELTPGTKGKATIPENGTIAASQVSTIVELDEVIRTFDPRTRAAFGDWLARQAESAKGRGDDLNQAFGTLPMFFSDSNDLLTVLRRQDAALSRIFANSADTFEAFDSRRGQLTDLITSGNKILSVTAKRSEQFAQTFREFPDFLRESRETLKRFTEFTEKTQPLIERSTTFAKEFSPTIKEASKVTGDARALITNIEPLLDAADAGLPATDQFLKLAQPTLGQLDPFLRQLNPVLEFVGLYKREITAFLANDAAATQYQFNNPGTKDEGHVVRAFATLSPDALAYLPQRTTQNRPNAYKAPGWYDKLLSGLEVFDATQCGSIAVPTLSEDTTLYTGGAADLALIIEDIKKVVYNGQDPANIPTPPCIEQPAQAYGDGTKYPHVRERTSP
jgi:virulence factor Mce-like protein